VERRRKHNHLRGRHGIDVVAVISSSASGEKAKQSTKRYTQNNDRGQNNTFIILRNL
jgi:hypothetical protein